MRWGVCHRISRQSDLDTAMKTTYASCLTFLILSVSAEFII